MSTGLGQVFRQHARNAAVRARAASDLERRMQDIIDACRTAWPELTVPAETFARHLAENLPEAGELEHCLAQMHCQDVYLACGCAAGDRAALAAFDRDLLGQVPPVLSRMGFSSSQIDEVVQVVRAKLLVASEDGRQPLITSYAGRGALVGWVRTAARRTALSLRRNKDEQIGGGSGGKELEGMPFPADVELDYLKSRYRVEFKRALEEAIAALDPEQLKILRLHYTDGLSIDRIGALLSVHRATAARWIHAAIDAVRDETRRRLREQLRLTANELDSLAGLVRSQIHLSLGRLLDT